MEYRSTRVPLRSYGRSYLEFVLALTCVIACDSIPRVEDRAPASSEDKPLQIIYLANREGEIEPCGCQVGQMGGLVRLHNWAKKELIQNRQDRLWIDSGDTFFALPHLPPTRIESEKAKARLIAESYRVLGLDAFVPGERDFALGVRELLNLKEETGATFLAANLSDDSGKAVFPGSILLKKSGKKLGLVGLVGKELESMGLHLKVSDSIEALKRERAALQSQGADLILVLSHLGLSQDKQLAQLDLADWIFGSHSSDPLDKPVKVGRTWIAQPQNQGQQVGRIHLDQNKLEPMDHRLFYLDQSYEGKNEATEWLASYQKQLRTLALQGSNTSQKTTAQTRDNDRYVANPISCRNCHVKQYDFWQATTHASAYLVLYAKNQHFNPDCVTCHSVGFEEPGGFQKVKDALVGVKQNERVPFVESFLAQVFSKDSETPLDSRVQPERYAALKKRYHQAMAELERKNRVSRAYLGVQCENCHGSRAGHPSSTVNTVKAVQESSCRSCHRGQHDPNFTMEKLAKVACPLSRSR